MVKQEQAQEKLNQLRKQYSYLNQFLSTLYKGSDTKEKIVRELIPLKREIEMLEWVLADDLPF